MYCRHYANPKLTSARSTALNPFQKEDSYPRLYGINLWERKRETLYTLDTQPSRRCQHQLRCLHIARGVSPIPTVPVSTPSTKHPFPPESMSKAPVSALSTKHPFPPESRTHQRNLMQQNPDHTNETLMVPRPGSRNTQHMRQHEEDGE